MPIRSHPFFQAPTGAVYAIAITPTKWGFVRFFRGNAVGALSIASDTPEMPTVNWGNPPVRWIFSSFAPRNDLTQVLRLGIVAFPDENSEWAPPCFVPPDPIDNCYKIHYKSSIRRASVEEIEGMQPCRKFTPAQMAEFLREKLNAGELQSV
jgi:hypothetical protein